MNGGSSCHSLYSEKVDGWTLHLLSHGNVCVFNAGQGVLIVRGSNFLRSKQITGTEMPCVVLPLILRQAKSQEELLAVEGVIPLIREMPDVEALTVGSKSWVRPLQILKEIAEQCIGRCNWVRWVEPCSIEGTEHDSGPCILIVGVWMTVDRLL